MKIGRNSTSLMIAFTEQEKAFIGSDRCNIQIDPGSRERWITVTGRPDGQRTFYTHNDSTHPVRTEIQCDLPQFGTELVNAVSPGPGILYGSKPTMSIPMKNINRGGGVPRPTVQRLTGMPGLDELKQAVLLVNNFKKEYGSQIELTLEDGVLRIRMMLEI